MRIQPITPFNVYNYRQNKQEYKQNAQNNVYNPIAYNPVNFTARLFRTPEDFYSCPWNKNGMPDTMKQYLNADYEDRQHMPPQQMLKLVFDDINETKNLEQVKRIFPEEPLFKNLTDTPNKKLRTGILAEIDIMKEEGKTLFKNGKDNLGHYILKKIYLEGKTLKEINEDFDKDKSVYYNGLSPIEYDTLRAFGIKFPNNSFWKSFTHNRENFKYEYKPRKPIERHVGGGASQRNMPSVTPRQRNRFEGVKDWEVDKLAEVLNKGNGNLAETRKQLRKSSVRDEASLNFVAKYMGEINSVVLEKLHVSPEMITFFEDADNLSKSQKQKLEAYWQDPERRELRSIIMKDTIKLFFDAYGVDGQNDEFKELLDYAHGIKPARIAQMKEHDRIQSEYDEMFAKLDAPKTPSAETTEIVEKSYEELLAEAKKGFNIQEYRFNTDQGEVSILTNLREALQESLEKETKFMPSAISNKFTKFVVSNDELPEKYILSRLLLEQEINLPSDDRLMPEDDVEALNVGLYQDFSEVNLLECRAAQQAVCDVFSKLTRKVTPLLLTLGLFEFIPIMQNLPKGGQELVLSNSKLVNSKFNEYKKPLSENEVRKITINVLELLRSYNPANTLIDAMSPYKGLDAIIYSYACYLKNQNPSDLKIALSNYIKEFGGSARYFLQKDEPREMKIAKLEQMLVHYASEHAMEFYKFALQDEQGINYIKYNNPEIYQQIIGY